MTKTQAGEDLKACIGFGVNCATALHELLARCFESCDKVALGPVPLVGWLFDTVKVISVVNKCPVDVPRHDYFAHQMKAVEALA